MELYFLRHAIATPRGDPKYKDDSLRPLTLEGKKKMHRTARGMRALNLTFDLILSSPYLRAKETAEIVSQVYQINNREIHLTDNLIPPASVEDLLQEIRGLGKLSPVNSVLLVGHEPHLSEMISCLLECTRPLSIDFKKGGLCSIIIEETSKKPVTSLKWLLTPAQLGLMVKEKQ